MSRLSAFKVAGFIALTTAVPAWAQTATPDISDKLQLCATCHGEAGTPAKPEIPIIWGQNEYYIYVELKDYKAGRRANETMNPIAADLSKEEMQALAKHFSEQPWPATSFPSDDAAARKAQSAMTAGACTSCHLGDLHGKSAIPRIADQQPVYLEKTILELKNNVRQNAPAKTALFSTYPDDELKALAVYLSSR
jgi:cytochrome c553